MNQVLSTLEPLPLPRGGRVLLKPNCLSAGHGPDVPVNTRAEVVLAAGRYLQEHHRLRLVIADSGGMGTYGRTKRVYAKMGLEEAAADLGAELINLEASGLVELKSPVGAVLPSFQATALLKEVDAIVNLPKMKTHMLTTLTGALKNCLGLLPGSLKRAVHIVAPSGRRMSLALVDIFAAIKPSLSLMDGVVAMEGQGPSNGRARAVGWLLASPDAVALDAVAARMMGLKPEEVTTIAAASDAGLGVGETERIRLLGASWSELALEDFRLPFSRRFDWLAEALPRGPVGWLINWLAEAKPRPIKKLCRRCGLCVEACPAEAMSLDDRGLNIETAKCIECYCCLEHCEHGALWVPRGLKDKLWPRAASSPS